MGKSMGKSRSVRLLLALSSAFLLVACGQNATIDELRQAVPKGTAFQNELAKLYLTYAEVEQQYGNYDVSTFFAEKGLKAAYGNDLVPEELDGWGLEGEQLATYQERREQLLSLLGDDIIKEAPRASAGGVFYYDCMVVSHGAAPSGEEFRYCEEQWQAMIGDLNEAQKELVARQSFDERDIDVLAANAQDGERFLVYFALDDFSLSDAAERTVELLFNELNKKTNITIVVNGHTDTSGADRYNLLLSNRRADTVKRMLVSLGMDPEQIEIFGFGETDLAVPTGNEVVERKNRRVEIVAN